MASGWDIQETRWPADLPTAVGEYAGGDEFAWLDSADADPNPAGEERFSMVCARPIAILEQFEGGSAVLRGDESRSETGAPSLEQFEGGTAVLRAGSQVLDEDQSAWSLWRRWHRSLTRLSVAPWTISPGWVGYVGFEMARQLERLPASNREDIGLPLLRLALYDYGIVLDHRERKAWAVTAPGDICDEIRSNGNPDWIERWECAASSAARPITCREVQLVDDGSRSAHEWAVRRALEYIAAGDIYQVNIARRIRLGGIAEPLSAYVAVRWSNPAPYGALLQWDGGAVASFSPELFLQLADREVLTRPIKGTRPRTDDAERDEVHRRDLIGSKKEAAELAMIVDLHRNDLGRVCEYGSVQVRHARRVEAHPTVFHTVADVVGRLRGEHDGIDLLAACFPAGSISGVPKIRAMEIIDELEPVARGAYTGAVGVLGLDGRMTFNVAIRTLQIRPPTATLYVGGGIVADSDPAAEYEETTAKARGILRGLGIECGRPVARQRQ